MSTNRIPLISQTDVFNKLREYTEKYPTSSRDKHTSDAGRLLREVMFSILQNIPIRAYIEEGETNETSNH